MPIFAERRKDVTAASAPAEIDENEIPLKKFFTAHDDSEYRFKRTGDYVKIRGILKSQGLGGVDVPTVRYRRLPDRDCNLAISIAMRPLFRSVQDAPNSAM